MANEMNTRIEFYSTTDGNLMDNIQVAGFLDKITFFDGLPIADLPYKDIIFSKMVQMDRWINSYLSRPHDNLGRTGPVCPYVPQAIKQKNILMTYYLCDKNTTLNNIQVSMQQYKIYFQKLKSLKWKDSKYYALLIVFIDVNDKTEQLSTYIEHTQRKLKSSFIQGGMMLGQFFKGCSAEGLYNKSFRPFDAPVATLGIRKLMPQDLIFMTDALEHMQLYIDKFQIKDEESLMSLLSAVCLDKNKNVLPYIDAFRKILVPCLVNSDVV